MAEVDAELLERVAHWCAEAGRQTGAGEIRAALEPLGWDELLAVRALLADPPPARPLGPFALADLARGAPADVAAERERAGRYRPEREFDPAPVPSAPTRATPRSKAVRRAAAVVVRRVRDRTPASESGPEPLPTVSTLMAPDGRAVLERLVRRHGARRALVLAELAAAYRRDDGGPPGEADLAALLDEHGLAHAFERRERDALLHAVRAAGGVRARAAAAVGLSVEGLDAALDRVGARAEAERVRDERRAELRGRATLTDRVHLLLGDPERLEDLGLLPEVEADLATRLREHVRALQTGAEPLRSALARSLSLGGDAVVTLETRFGLALGPAADVGGETDRPTFAARPRGAAVGGAAAPRRSGPPRGDRPDRPRVDRPDRPRFDRPDRPRSDRPERPRTDRPDRPRFDRPERPQTDRPDRPRFDRAERPRTDRPDRPRFDRAERPRTDRPDRPRADRPDRPRADRPDRPRADRPDRPRADRPDRPRTDRPERPRFDRPDRPRTDRPERPRFDRPDRPRADRPDRPRFDRPERPRTDRPDRPRPDRSGAPASDRARPGRPSTPGGRGPAPRGASRPGAPRPAGPGGRGPGGPRRGPPPGSRRPR
jgi:hypothetical protein